ncbi:hypothetical protein FACS189485_18400 [Spirochaetia bacterium]|nr:hypothetical protein FACS189485_18400 [Spirochaetia bacterium]
MVFVVKKTIELTEYEQGSILTLFNVIFKKERTILEFHNQFTNNVFGYSYHAMILDENRIVGHFAYIPAYYNVNAKRYLSAVSADAMVDEKYRGFINFYSMIVTLHKYLETEGIVFVHAFPNDNSYPVFIKGKLMGDIGRLTTYCLPYRIGGIKPGLKALNWLSIIFVRLYVFLVSLIAGKKIYRLPIEKEVETYNATRYKRLDGNYNMANFKGSEFVYKIMDYEGIRSAFLIDIFEKSATNFNKAVQYIIKNHGKEFDILLYVGYLPFRCHGLIKVPQKLAPKNFNFIGEILKNDEIDKDLFFNINNWDVNLSNYDLL